MGHYLLGTPSPSLALISPSCGLALLF